MGRFYPMLIKILSASSIFVQYSAYARFDVIVISPIGPGSSLSPGARAAAPIMRERAKQAIQIFNKYFFTYTQPLK